MQGLTSPRLPFVFTLYRVKKKRSRGEWRENLKTFSSIPWASEELLCPNTSLSVVKTKKNLPPHHPAIPFPLLRLFPLLPRGGGLIPLSDASVCNSKLTREERKQTSSCREKPAKHIVHDRFSSCVLRSPQRTRRCEPRATHAWLIPQCRGQ